MLQRSLAAQINKVQSMFLGRHAARTSCPGVKFGDIVSLTSIRGLAAWWVVLFHFKEEIPRISGTLIFTVLSHGYLAVDLFFQLSGFVMALNYSKMFERLETNKVKEFFVMRFARIYPLHIIMLLLYVSIPVAISYFSSRATTGDRFGVGYFLLSIFLVQNWGFTSNLDWNIPAWSLSAEFGAYLIFPVLMIVINRLLRGVVSSIGLGLLLMVAVCVVSTLTGKTLEQEIAHLGLFRCVVEFCIGISLWGFWKFRRNRAWTFEGDVAVLIAVILLIPYILGIFADFVIFPAVFFLVIYCILDKRSLFARFLGMKVLEWLGVVSYSTYMVHYFVKEWVKFIFVKGGGVGWLPVLIYVGAVVLASAVLYQVVEVPARRMIRAKFLRLPSHRSLLGSLPN